MIFGHLSQHANNANMIIQNIHSTGVYTGFFSQGGGGNVHVAVAIVSVCINTPS